MEANEAPEKIYIFDNPILDFTRLSVRQSNDDIEYIRKDAFIEKAYSWLKENKDKYLYNTGEKEEYIPTCSRKMIDEFKAYMEGE